MEKSTHTADYRALIAELKQLRAKAGLTQRELAAVLGVPHSWIAKVEAGERRIDLVEFCWFARACGSDPTAFLEANLRRRASQQRRSQEVTTPLDPALRKRLRKVFKMPLVQSMQQRKSSITNAFVNAVIPAVRPSEEEILEAITILDMTVEDVRCAYCGDPKTTWDHLRPLVVDRRPTGYISEIGNLVPCCSTCNSSKGNANWQTWMLGQAPNSPTFRMIADVDKRIARVQAYEAWRPPTCVDFEAILGSEAWAHYWSLWSALNIALDEAQIVGDQMRDLVKAGQRSE